jgi:hypothetical protein
LEGRQTTWQPLEVQGSDAEALHTAENLPSLIRNG